MAKARNTKINMDTDQTKVRNEKNSINNEIKQKEPFNLVENSMRNDQNSVLLDDINDDDHKLTIEIKINKQEVPDDNEATGLALNIIEGLIKEWIKLDMIQGVFNFDGLVRTSNWVEVGEWTKPPKVIR